MNYRVVEKLNGIQLEELKQLFKNEWWTQERKSPDIEQMVENSTVVIGLIEEETGKLAGFARAISDTIYRAIIFDVIVHQDNRNNGLGILLMESMMNHPLIQKAERIELYCPDSLISYYEKFGFTTNVNGSNLMRRK
ncbi:GNAT family N-acetyltransferase [Fictibacillus nanhaiensis]|uniref:GNAT family N-acetyltransferase n=1 Tax=Fictibacillus nanhaiensis TaxID=742169 RepID=UPI001C973DC6|nr:GNAT family N-acetyltransferase [Fictibacillus nanhaiensis]MBY6037238.1 GNAT family N-acetyltransferase [Fictibacillus nanhaiensis]